MATKSRQFFGELLLTQDSARWLLASVITFNPTLSAIDTACSRMGIPIELPLNGRLTVLGLNLVRFLELNPIKRGRGRPKGAKKSLHQRGTPEQRRALDWYEARRSELPVIPYEKRIALSNGIREVFALIPPDTPSPKNPKRFLATLVRLAGGRASVAIALGVPPSTVDAWLKTEHDVASAQTQDRRLWNEAVRLVPLTGNPDRTTINTAMRRLRKSRQLKRLAVALLEPEN